MTPRQRFEAHYIADHFGESLRIEQMLYRDAITWVYEQRFGNEYIDADIQEKWQEFKATYGDKN